MQVSLERSGGFANIPFTVTVDTTTLPAPEAEQLRNLVETADFFNLPEDLTRPAQPDRFQYQLTVDTGDRRHCITVGEAAMPASLKPLVQWLMQKGRQS